MSPSIGFVGQPFAGPGPGAERNLYRFLEVTLGRASARRLTIVTAWVKRGGLEYLDPLLTAFHARGGRSRLITGVDGGIATAEGLRLAVKRFTKSYVVHDPGGAGRTFHPKIYLAQGSERHDLLVGSSNLTGGGMWANYEASLVLVAERGDPAGEAVVRDIQTYIARLLRDPTCRRLTETLIGEMEADPAVQFAPDTRVAERRSADVRDEDDPDPVFGRTAHTFAPAPPRVRLDNAKGRPSVGTTAASRRPGAPPTMPRGLAAEGALTVALSLPAVPPAVTHRWYKELSASDAQRNAGNKTHVLRLGQAGAPIDHNTWFRYTLFADADWTVEVIERHHARARGGGVYAPVRRYERHTATVNFDVTMGSDRLGQVPLNISHATARTSDQANVPTVLHWGQLQHRLGVVKDFTGFYATLERTGDDRLRLHITRDHGRFMV